MDGCKKGWVVAIVSLNRKDGKSYSPTLCGFFVAGDFEGVMERADESKLICVDIPIGLSDNGNSRLCDVEARKLLGRPRASSIFTLPGRPCLSAENYRQARSINLKYTGRKLSKQSYNLLPKIRQVDKLMTPELQQNVREIHPELCFFVLNGQKPVAENKKTEPGQAKRFKLLHEIFRDLGTHLRKAPGRGYSIDDALDAAVAAWTAAEAVRAKAITLPARPETDGRGLRMEILCPSA